MDLNEVLAAQAKEQIKSYARVALLENALRKIVDCKDLNTAVTIAGVALKGE